MDNVEQIYATIDKTVASFLNDLPGMLRQQLQNHVAVMLGFRNWNHGKWEVDTFNKEGNVNKLINARIENTVKDVVEKLTWKPKEAQIDAIARKFESEIQYQLDCALRKKAEQVAESLAEKIKTQLDNELLPTLIPQLSLKNLSDPKFMGNMPNLRDAVGKAILDGIPLKE